MLTLGGVKRKIKTIGNIEKITRAMMLVALTKLRRAEEKFRAIEHYVYNLEEMLQDLLIRMEKKVHPFLSQGRGPTLFIILTSNRGLCGGFNTNLIKYAQNYLNGKESKLIFIGRKGRFFFKNYEMDNIIYSIDIPEEEKEFVLIDKLIDIIFNNFGRNLNEICLIYNKFISKLSQKPCFYKLLPIELKKEKIYKYPDYICEPTAELIVNSLFKHFIKMKIYHILLETIAAEHAARTTAMEAATKNAQRLKDELWLTFCKLRQESITKEITEIISTTEAIKQ